MKPILITEQVIQKQIVSELINANKDKWTQQLIHQFKFIQNKLLPTQFGHLNLYQEVTKVIRSVQIRESNFYIRAKSPNTVYSASVALKDKHGNYIDRLIEKGWFHWDDPILFKNASAIWMEQPEKVSDTIKKGLIPEEASFIYFGLNLNHKGQKVEYQICAVHLTIK